jgi:RNA polymerase sigma-70 factor (ECF subfamily)
MSRRVDADEMLAARAATGDRDAFDELVRRYQVRIFRLARILTRGDRQDAEDLAQETFIRAYRAVGRFRHDATFQTWLHRIALNVIWSYLARRRIRGADLSLIAGEGEPNGRPMGRGASSGDDVEAALIRREAIDRALATLSTEARLAITLRDIQGLDYQEIATIMGVPIGTVESRIFRARRRLRPLLEPLRHMARQREGI